MSVRVSSIRLEKWIVAVRRRLSDQMEQMWHEREEDSPVVRVSAGKET